MQNYEQVIEYLFAQLPMFTRDGAVAYKKDLSRTLELCEAVGNPQNRIKTIHVAGTNGKGSTSHMLAAVLASNGYKTGLYTSPHLVDFRERVRINGDMIDKSFVIDFVNQQKGLIEKIQPSFFEVTVAMALSYFEKEKVDIAIIETGLGGRLDSTNVIRPLVSIITNIGLDHTQILGDTIQEIAFEKAGVIKYKTPVIISEKDEATSALFEQKARDLDAEIVFATDRYSINSFDLIDERAYATLSDVERGSENRYELDLTGSYQVKNLVGVLATLDKLVQLGLNIAGKKVSYGLKNVKKLTSFQGRWQTLSKSPMVICDTGHNVEGIKEVLKNISNTPHSQLRIVFGAMRDKDLSKILPLLPKEATYYYCNPNIPRALPAAELLEMAEKSGLKGTAYTSVDKAIVYAIKESKPSDLIFVGGSTFVVAEALINR